MKSSTVLKFVSVFLLAGVLALAGCGKAPESTGPGKTATAVSMAAIAADATGFSVGAVMSARTVYVFFDAQCPHCGDLWDAAKPLKTQARFVWIPVGILNAASTSQGASLLAASDPAAAMDAHEASLRARQGGLTATSAGDAQKAAIAKNTVLFNSFGFTSIPTLVAANAQTGGVATQEGAVPTAALAAFLGMSIPAAQP